MEIGIDSEGNQTVSFKLIAMRKQTNKPILFFAIYRDFQPYETDNWRNSCFSIVKRPITSVY